MSLGKVIIGGGTGYIGSNLVKRLAKEGYTTICVSRESEAAPLTWRDIERCGLPNDTHTVINVAGVNVFSNFWTNNFKQEVRDSRIGTTKMLANAITNTKAENFITISGVGYYKPDENIIYNEDTQCKPFDFFSQLCHDWEAAAKLPSDSKIRQVTIRSGVVLGKDSPFDQQLRTVFKMYLGGVLGSGKQCLPWIHINDLVNMFLFAMKYPRITGILNGVAPQIVTNEEFTATYAKALGVFAVLPFTEFMANLVFSKDRAVMLLEGQKVEPAKALKLGFKYEFPTISSACQAIM